MRKKIEKIKKKIHLLIAFTLILLMLIANMSQSKKGSSEYEQQFELAGSVFDSVATDFYIGYSTENYVALFDSERTTNSYQKQLEYYNDFVLECSYDYCPRFAFVYQVMFDLRDLNYSIPIEEKPISSAVYKNRISFEVDYITFAVGDILWRFRYNYSIYEILDSNGNRDMYLRRMIYGSNLREEISYLISQDLTPIHPQNWDFIEFQIIVQTTIDITVHPDLDVITRDIITTYDNLLRPNIGWDNKFVNNVGNRYVALEHSRFAYRTISDYNGKNYLLKYRAVRSISTIGIIYNWCVLPNLFLYFNVAIEKPNPVVFEDSLGTTYWEYTSYNIHDWYSEVIYMNASNPNDVNYTFQYIEGYKATSNFYYNETQVNQNDMGNWIVDFGTLGSISFNWLRDGIVVVLNFVLFIFQLIAFLVWVGIQYSLLFVLFMYIVPFFNNFVWYYILFGIVYVLYWLVKGSLWLFKFVVDGIIWFWDNVIYPFILWLWNDILLPFLLWVWNYVLLPFLEFIRDVAIWVWDNWLVSLFNWIVYTAFPFLADLLIFVISFIEALVIYIFMLGRINFVDLFGMVQTWNTLIFDTIMDLIDIFFRNIVEILLYISIYLLLILFLFAKMIYVKAKGYTARVEALNESLQAYLIPIKFVIAIIKEIKQFVNKTG